MALGDGTHKLPVHQPKLAMADIRQAIGEKVGQTVRIVLEQRITR